MKRGALDDVPLTVLFPDLSPAGVTSLKDAARAADAASVNSEAEWEWVLGHAVFPGLQPGTPIILGMDVITHANGADPLEFLLHVVWTDPGRLAVETAVNVACWCDSDHASHDVDAVRHAVDDPALLPHTLRAGAQRLNGWLADPRDADYWRATAGLPARPSALPGNRRYADGEKPPSA
ncbi:hypothetical protein [Streptomyces sp. NPDC058867]|uniref:hypothetical protein n=1 Tax=unclassified Streptomyces TaxID=2593676 RepID=UPI0036AE2292